MANSRWERNAQEAGASVAPPPFRLSGPGWYKSRGGVYWTKLAQDQIDLNYDEDGSIKRGFPDISHDLIAKATPEQERVLEGL